MELGNFKDKRVGCLLFKKFNFINVDMSRHNYEFKRKKYYLQAMNKIERKKNLRWRNWDIFPPNFQNTLFRTPAISPNIFETSLHSS